MGYKITTISGTMVTLASLGIPDPKGSFEEGAEMRDLASGGARLIGYPRAVWHWDFLTRENYDTLRTNCMPDFSGMCGIETSTNENEDEFETFSVKYIFPFQLSKDSGRRIPFDIEFRRAVVSLPMTVNSSEHGHTAENTSVVILVVYPQSSEHDHQVEQPDLTQVHNLASQSSEHDHQSAQVTLTQQHTLIVQSSEHDHQAENVVLV